MARKFLVPIDLSQLEIRNAVIQVLASAPSSPVEGQVYYDSTTHKAYIYNGSAWKALDEYVAVTFATAGTSAVGDSAAEGAASTAARSDHTHGRESFGATASTQAVGDSAAGGSATTPSRSDHKHALPGFGSATAQTSFGSSSANGSATTIARSDHTHGTPAHDGSAHSSVSLSSLAVPTADLSAGTYKITNLGTPSASTDAATKGYVDTAVGDAIAGLAWKDSVAAASSSDVTISNPGTSSIGGATLTSGDRVLLYGQSTGSQNGIYVFNGSGAAMTRATDADTAADLRGAAVFVEDGTDAGKQFILTTDGFTLGTTSLTFAQFGQSTTYTAGDGLTLSGTTFNVGAGTGISVGSDTVSIDTSVVARKYATAIGDGSATSYTVTHSLGTLDVIVQVYAVSGGAQVECDVTHATTNTVTVGFASAPASNTYRVVVTG